MPRSQPRPYVDADPSTSTGRAGRNAKEAHDVLHYTEPYPGDTIAKRPVFTYDYDDDWEILVYFVKFCFYEVARLPDSLGDRLCSIDLMPKKRIPFEGIEFPAAFIKKHVVAVDAAWNEYADGTGLAYDVYTTRTLYGSTKPGELILPRGLPVILQH